MVATSACLHAKKPPGARTLSLRHIYAGGEEEAYATFCKFRWADAMPLFFNGG